MNEPTTRRALVQVLLFDVIPVELSLLFLFIIIPTTVHLTFDNQSNTMMLVGIAALLGEWEIAEKIRRWSRKLIRYTIRTFITEQKDEDA